MRSAKLSPLLVAVLCASSVAAAQSEKVQGYAEWRRGDIVIVDGQRVRVHAGTELKGDDVYGLESIPLGYEVKAKGIRQDDGVILAEEIEAKPNGQAMFEADVLKATDEMEAIWLREGVMFEPDEEGGRKTIGPVVDSGPEAQRVRGIMARLLPPYVPADSLRVHVVQTEHWNAAAMGNGAIWVYTGLIDEMSDDELAVILGHELAHYTHEHSRRHAKSAMWRSLLGVGALVALSELENDTARAAATVAAVIGLTVWGSGYSRDLEDQADRVGLRYAYEGGYDIYQAPGLWLSFKEKYGESGSVTNFFFGSHSRPSDRIRNIQREMLRNYR